MKKLLTASFLTLGIILISGCSLSEQKPVDNSAMTEQITALQKQMSGFSSEMETLKQENEQLKIENQSFKTTIEENAINKQFELDKEKTKEPIEEKTNLTSQGNIQSIKVQSSNTIKQEKNIICKNSSQFKNEAWAENLNNLYKKQFLEPQGIFDANIWPHFDLEGRDSCIIENYFIFIPAFSEFGCMRIFKYDIEKNILHNTIFGEELCAGRFGEITNSYIEYFGIVGDGLYNTEYHGKYFYLTNTQELIEKKNVKIE